MKKRILAMLMAVVMLFAIVGCGNSAAESYKTMAQGFIDDGNIEAAKKALEDGIAETKSKELQAMLDGLSNADLSDYDGTWAEEDLSYENGGLIMNVSTTNGATMLSFEFAGESIGFTDGPLDHSILKNEVDGSTITIKKSKDIYENIVDMAVTFSDDTVTCEITNVEDAGVSPLLKEGTYTLVRNEDAYTVLAETPWSDAMGAKADGFTETPYYDTSKASGILAQAGLTEEQFRTICIPISTDFILHYNHDYSKVSSADRFHIAYGKQYFTEHPEDTSVQEETSTWQKICNDYQANENKYKRTVNMGMFSDTYHKYEKYGDLETYLNDTVYGPKGEDILFNSSKQLFNRMKEFPNEYLGKPYVLVGFDIESNNNNVYTDENFISTSVVVIDLRDDVHAPNIIKGNDYYPYVKFEGTFVDAYGNIGLKFSMLSIEKIEEVQ